MKKILVFYLSFIISNFCVFAQTDTLEQIPKFKKNALKVQFSFPRPLIGILGAEYERKLGNRTTLSAIIYYANFTDVISSNLGAKGLNIRWYGTSIRLTSC
jgi:hypothetical protein